MGSNVIQTNERRSAQEELTPEDSGRARLYAMLARLFSAPPDAMVIEALGGLAGGETPMGKALSELSEAARSTTVETARQEFDALFIGMGRGELVPHASYYLTGFLNEKPLAKLRTDLRAIGIGRVPSNKVPEDHIASLCEVMAGLIEGTFGKSGAVSQSEFFSRHLAGWAGKFFGDLERAESARLYVPVGSIGRLFFAIEETAFDLAA